MFIAEFAPDVGLRNKAILVPSKRAALGRNNLWEEYRELGFSRRLHPLASWSEQVLPLK